MTTPLIQTASATQSYSNVQTLTATFTLHPSEGNIVLIGLVSKTAISGLTLPAGYAVASTSNGGRLILAWKLAVDNEDTEITCSWTSTADNSAMVLLEYAGVDRDVPFDSFVTPAITGGTSQTSGTSSATSREGNLALAFFGVLVTNAFGTISFNNSFTSVLQSSSGGTAPKMAVAGLEAIAISSTVETTISGSGAGSSVEAILVILNQGPLVSGVAAITDRTSTTATLECAAASGGDGPYTYQWHRSTNAGFTPGAGNLLSGETDLTLADTGLTEGVTYYYVLVATDDASATASSNEVGVTTSSTPLIVITDDQNNTTGIVSIMGPGFVSFHATASIRGGGEWVHTKVEWDFGDPGTRGNEIRGFAAGHLYELEPGVNTDFTVTCTITNQVGVTTSATRTVRVTPNTRRIVYVDPDIGSASPTDPTDSADPYDTIANLAASEDQNDLEIRMAAGKTHTWGASIGGSNKDNVIVRSTVAGTKWHCVTTVDVIVYGGSYNGLKDAYFDVSGFGAYCLMLDPRSIGGFRCWVKDCVSVDTDVATLITSANSKSTGIIDVTTSHAVRGDIFYAGQLLTVIGHNSSNYTGDERPYRGNGRYATFRDCIGQYNATSSKTCFTRHGGHWLWVDKCQFYIGATAVSSGWAMQLGHTAAAYNPGVHYAVVERTLLQVAAGISGTFYPLYIGATLQEVDSCIVRNCLLLNRSVTMGGADPAYPASNCWLIHNTITSEVNRWLTISGEQHDNTIKNNLSIGNGVTPGPYAVYLNGSTFDTVLNDNVWPSTSGNVDIKVDANNPESWGAFNARGLGSGNIASALSIDGSYRPTEINNADLLITKSSEMTAFPEDYYGNARQGTTWVAGAVGDIPTATQVLAIQAGGQIYLIGV